MKQSESDHHIDPSLLIRFFLNETNEDENRVIHAWRKASPENLKTFQQLRKTWHLTSLEEIDRQIDINSEFEILKERIALTEQKKRRPEWWSWSSKAVRIAASLLVLLAFGTLLIYHFSSSKHPVVMSDQSVKVKNDIAPGGDKAILTLADGSTIVLDNAQNGTLASQGKTKILKLNNGQLIYNGANGHSATGQILYNTIATPKGGQYQVVLSDGSKVWLNASSSLKFPIAFSGDSRRIEITGEAYFEVSKMKLAAQQTKRMPFIVKANGVEVEVLGTHFNIMAYSDEKRITTTLLEGSVKVKRGKAVGLLKPGQEASLSVNTKNENIQIQKADLEEAVAWKNGRFQFNNEDLKTIMRQVMRWYDVNVIFRDGAQDRYFTANISRNTNLMELLKVFEMSKIHFKLEGKNLIVLP